MIAPKRQGLYAAEENLDKLMEVLQVKRDELQEVTEKLDGQNLMFSWKDGQLVAARNQGHLKNAGAAAPNVKEFSSIPGLFLVAISQNNVKGLYH